MEVLQSDCLGLKPYKLGDWGTLTQPLCLMFLHFQINVTIPVSTEPRTKQACLLLKTEEANPRRHSML